MPIRYLWIAVLACTGCAAELEDPERFRASGDPATTCDAPTEILAAKCTSCHAGAGASGTLDLTADPRSFVGAPAHGGAGLLVDPASPENSVLLLKVQAAPFGARMPQGGAPLSDAEIACMRAWVGSIARSGGAK